MWLPTQDGDVLINTNYVKKFYYVKLANGKYPIRAIQADDNVYVYDLVAYDTEEEAKEYIVSANRLLNYDAEIERTESLKKLFTKEKP